jgi:hypothetical protein
VKTIYRIFSESGELLYVGQSINVPQRISQHAKWLVQYPGYTVTTDGPHHPVIATMLERRAILTEDPRKNKAWRHYGGPAIETATIAARDAAVYLCGQQPRYEGWCVQIVEGYGLKAVNEDRPWYVMPRYLLRDVEAKYLELNSCSDVERLAARRSAA